MTIGNSQANSGLLSLTRNLHLNPIRPTAISMTVANQMLVKAVTTGNLQDIARAMVMGAEHGITKNGKTMGMLLAERANKAEQFQEEIRIAAMKDMLRGIAIIMKIGKASKQDLFKTPDGKGLVAYAKSLQRGSRMGAIAEDVSSALSQFFDCVTVNTTIQSKQKGDEKTPRSQYPHIPVSLTLAQIARQAREQLCAIRC
jgi:hypothetical protein